MSVRPLIGNREWEAGRLGHSWEYRLSCGGEERVPRRDNPYKGLLTLGMAHALNPHTREAGVVGA